MFYFYFFLQLLGHILQNLLNSAGFLRLYKFSLDLHVVLQSVEQNSQIFWLQQPQLRPYKYHFDNNKKTYVKIFTVSLADTGPQTSLWVIKTPLLEEM
jgi:hypothetical protein